MRLIHLLFFGLALASPMKGEETDFPSNAELEKFTDESAKKINEMIGSDWIVSAKGQTVTIESTFDIFSIPVAKISTSRSDADAAVERLQKEAQPQKYIIRLRFKKLLEREEFVRRRSEKQKHADVLTFGADTRTEWSEAAKAYNDIQLPQYREMFYDVYRELPESPVIQIYPLSALEKIGAAKEVLNTIFSPIRTGSD